METSSVLENLHDASETTATPESPGISTVSFPDALRFWAKLGLISFGGPTGQIAIMHTELVEKRKWISESRFLHALNYCMLLPGPEAQQLAVYVGWLLHRTIGGIAAGALFVLPSILVLWSLSYIYAAYGNVEWIHSVFYGLKGGVTAIVAAAVLRIGTRALKNGVMWTIAAAAFVSIFFLNIAFPFIILAAAAIGFLGGRIFPRTFQVIRPHQENAPVDNSAARSEHHRPSFLRAIKVLTVSLVLWWFPIWMVGLWLGYDHTLFREGIFFSKAAMVTFGGAYAVLPYVAQQAVQNYHWLLPGQMMDGLGLAETTPGPLIMVVQFVGFLAAWNNPGGLPPLLAASLGALLTTWVTFVPCFLWIFLGAPHIEQMRGNAALSSSLSAVTAAVVGVVLNLAVWFALHTIFSAATGVDWFLVALSTTSFAILTVFKWDLFLVILLSAAAGFVYRLF